MAIIQCANQHYYDDSKNLECPYCLKLQTEMLSEELGEQMTSYYTDYGETDGQKTEAYDEFVNEFDKTIGVFFDDTQNELTVGWLVCTSGFEKGKSHVVHSGRNFAGRAIEMDIVLQDDEKISKHRHFSIVYDPKSITFYLVSGEGYIYVNGKVVSAECVLKDGDEITAGESKYIFVPFCKEGREWE